MNYFKINYNKLENLPQIKFHRFILLLLLIIMSVIMSSYFINTYHTLSTYGYYKDNEVHIKINNKLSDAVKNSEYITFNNVNTTSLDTVLEDYEIIDNEIYQNIKITLDKKFLDNEIGLLKIHYRKQKLLFYILELFK